ncbi:MAG TPA: hypothetical protein DDX68_18630 [Clostridium sp.]|nr:hypothetical protein [Clostridium sp.]
MGLPDTKFMYEEKDYSIYAYKGYLKVVVNGKGKIKKAFLIYGENANEITDGNINTTEVKNIRNNQFEIGRNLNFQTQNINEFKRFYLVINDKKDNKKSIFCIAINLNSINPNQIIQFTDGRAFVNQKSIDTVENIKYEARSRDEIRAMVYGAYDSYIAKNKKVILEDIEKIEKMSLE